MREYLEAHNYSPLVQKKEASERMEWEVELQRKIALTVSTGGATIVALRRFACFGLLLEPTFANVLSSCIARKSAKTASLQSCGRRGTTHAAA